MYNKLIQKYKRDNNIGFFFCNNLMLDLENDTRNYFVFKIKR